MWDNGNAKQTNDLDLWVNMPNGEYIYWNNLNAFGGTLDVDRQQSTVDPVENIVWPNGAPAGEYTVAVKNYEDNFSGAKDFIVAIVKDGGEMEIFNMEMPDQVGNFMDIVTFVYTPPQQSLFLF